MSRCHDGTKKPIVLMGWHVAGRSEFLGIARVYCEHHLVEAHLQRVTQIRKTTGKSVMWDDQTEDCELGFFQGASCAGDLRDSKSTSGGYCAYLDHTRWFPLPGCAWKQTAVSHSSAEFELVSLDGFAEVCLQRVTGLTCSSCMSPAVESWHVPVFLLQSSSAGRVS